MKAEQLPYAVREFADHLRALLARVDRYDGWCPVFWQRDPEGMRAWVEGREPPPWDMVEALLHDLAAAHGPAAAEAEVPRARALHTAALAAYDARPGARAALSGRLDVVLRERRYAARRRTELARELAAATTSEAARALRAGLAWADDDHRRATARCAEITARLRSLDRHTPGAEPLPPPSARHEIRLRAPAPARTSAAAADRTSAAAPGPARVTGERPAPVPPEAPAFSAGPGSFHAGRGSDAPGFPAGTGPAPGAPGPTAPDGREPALGAGASGTAPLNGPAARRDGGDPTPAGPGPGHDAGRADPRPDGAGPVRPPAPAPPVTRARGRRRGGARFAGVGDEETGAVVVPPVAARAVPASRGARFAGAGEAPGEGAASWSERPAGEADRQEVARTVAELTRLRAEGRSGEAHALLTEAAASPAARFPLFADAMRRAGLGADWTTLLWEAAAALPADRLVVAADALTRAGHAADGERLLRHGVVRPADEIGRAALALDAQARHREVRALLDACVRMRTPADAAGAAAADPRRLVPLLLTVSRDVSETRHRDLLYALRVAGLAL
ncbi:hypothetical protein [Streptomyces griseoflavus]|uniref:hypothetical protein n=1 Tax=Streptomyces griseoflavus TaxID=35619 RepID=UPI00167DEF77|nr:hypothetical protein [Streptomyces griseoflavus]